MQLYKHLKKSSLVNVSENIRCFATMRFCGKNVWHNKHLVSVATIVGGSEGGGGISLGLASNVYHHSHLRWLPRVSI